MSTKPIRLHDLPGEARRIQREAVALLDEFSSRGADPALLLRAKDLRRRSRSLGAFVEAALTRQMAIAIAYRERTGQNIADGDVILPADDARAREIISTFHLSTRQC